MKSEICFLLTGCTAGLGLALLERLVDQYPESHFIAICRNSKKANLNFSKIIQKLKKHEGRLDCKSSTHNCVGVSLIRSRLRKAECSFPPTHTAV